MNPIYCKVSLHGSICRRMLCITETFQLYRAARTVNLVNDSNVLLSIPVLNYTSVLLCYLVDAVPAFEASFRLMASILESTCCWSRFLGTAPAPLPAAVPGVLLAYCDNVLRLFLLSCAGRTTSAYPPNRRPCTARMAVSAWSGVKNSQKAKDVERPLLPWFIVHRTTVPCTDMILSTTDSVQYGFGMLPM